jgi:dTDP-4-dehydrorhamnose 3,5-epimerase
MRRSALALPGIELIEPARFDDERGWLFETWNERTLASAGIDVRFVQQNVSVSRRLALRGLHYQVPHPQGKLIRVLKGEIFDVVVDLRRSSATFGEHLSVRLSASPISALWVPVGFAHGFLALSDDTEVEYQLTDFWYREAEHTLRWNDPAIAIPWPLSSGTMPILSEKDRQGLSLAEAPTFP